MSIKKAEIGFTDPLIKNVSLKLHGNSRIGLLGFNGAGKSTLLKTIAGQLSFLSGDVVSSKHIKVGYFAQHQVDVMDMQASPMLMMQRMDATVREQEVRNFLGGFDFRGDRVSEPIHNFSGGEKARLALALIVWQKPNLLLLDEPTNHLDLEMRHALTVALQGFEGALVLVSHDRHLMSNTVDEFYTVHRGQLSAFDGDLDDYARWLQDPDGLRSSPAGKDIKPVNTSTQTTVTAVDKKDQRKQAAAQREQLAPLRREIRTLEQKMEKLSAELASLEEKLGDATLYEDKRRNDLTELLRQQGYCKAELNQCEEHWLLKSTELESLCE